ncbi:MAG: hypothetical protein IKW51_08650 [Bacteroidales bacterium]|nr:hypothetical protein [Bacteroidales bacterium]
MNNIKNGMVILEQTDTKQQAVFIEEEQLDMLRLKAMFKKRDKEKAAIEKKNYIKECRNKAWKRYTIKTFYYIGIRIMFVGASVLTVITNLVHPIIGIVVGLYCFSTACINLGIWYNKWSNRKS